jgi:OOP family OmpA-OmpF porin
MKKLLFSLIALGFIFNAHAQSSNGGQKKRSIAIRFNALDFASAESVQNGTIGSTLNAKQWGQYASTTKSFGVNYTRQYTDQVDIFTNFDLGITRLPLYAPNALRRSNEDLLTSVESGLNIKMFKGDYRINPYVTAGLGVRSFAFRTYSAYAPVGLGLQIKTCKGSNLNITSTYSTKMSKSFVPSFNYGVSYSFLLN